MIVKWLAGAKPGWPDCRTGLRGQLPDQLRDEGGAVLARGGLKLARAEVRVRDDRDGQERHAEAEKAPGRRAPYRALMRRSALSIPTRAHQPIFDGSLSVVFSGVSPPE